MAAPKRWQDGWELQWASMLGTAIPPGAGLVSQCPLPLLPDQGIWRRRRANRRPRLGLKGDSICRDNSHWHSPDVNPVTVFIFKVSDAVVQILVSVIFRKSLRDALHRDAPNLVDLMRWISILRGTIT